MSVAHVIDRLPRMRGPSTPPRRIKVYGENDPRFAIVVACYELEASAALYNLQTTV